MTAAAKKAQLQPPFGPSVDLLCHPWVTTTNPSYRFPIFETSAAALCGTTGIYIYIPHQICTTNTISLQKAAAASGFAFSRFCFETPVGWQRFSWQVLSQTAWWRYIGRIPKNVIRKVGANFTQLPSDWTDKTWCIVEGRRSLTIHVANKDRARCFSVCDASLVYVVLVKQMHSESITNKKIMTNHEE